MEIQEGYHAVLVGTGVRDTTVGDQRETESNRSGICDICLQEILECGEYHDNGRVCAVV